MSTLQKRIVRIRSLPKDYTYTEARSLLISLGFVEFNKGKTSGSRIRFYRKSDGKLIDLHKPHPGDVMKVYAVKDLYDFLVEIGEL